MSSLWTPGGERPIRRPEPEQSSTSGESQAASARAAAGRQQQELSPEEQAAQLQQLQEQLARTALHLGLQPPQLDQARLAIDALAALVEGLAGRLGEHEPQLRDGLAQLRLAFVQIQAAQRPNGGQAGDPAG